MADGSKPFSDAGIIADGRTDCTAAIQRVLDNRPLILPYFDKPYIASSLLLSRHLTLQPGTVLLKNPDSDHNEPLIRGHDREFSLTGGVLRATKPTPNGVLQIGPLKDKKRNIVFWRVRDVTIDGVQGVNSTGICLSSSEPTVGGANYAGVIRDCLVMDVDYGIRSEKWCNGHTFDGNRFHQITKVAMDFTECTGCSGTGGFVHHSHNATCLRLRKCGFMEFNGFMGEPGGPNGRYLETDDDCFAWAVRTQQNVTLPSILKGKTWTFETHGEVKHGPQA